MSIFGLSNARYYMMFKNNKKRKARVHRQIIEVMKGSLIIMKYSTIENYEILYFDKVGIQSTAD